MSPLAQDQAGTCSGEQLFDAPAIGNRPAKAIDLSGGHI
jgi:hypothetical protein